MESERAHDLCRSGSPVQQSSGYTSDNAAKWECTNGLWRRHLNLYLDTLYSLLRSTDARTVLDVGCGEGFVCRAMRDRGFSGSWTGSDSSKAALQYAMRMNPESDWIAGSIFDLPFASRCFDLVLCTQVLEHLADPERGLRETARCSRQWVLVSVPLEPIFRLLNHLLTGLRLTCNPNHIQHWRPADFRRFLSRDVQDQVWRRSTVYQIVLGTV